MAESTIQTLTDVSAYMTEAARAARAREAEMDAQEAPDGEGPDLLEEGA